MAKTYDSSLTDDKDQVRFLISDNVDASMMLEDSEIRWVLTQEANVYAAAAALADSLAQRMRAASVATKGTVQKKKVGDTEVTYDTALAKFAEYEALAKTLRGRGSAHQVPYAGGISRAESAAIRADTDRPVPDIERGMHDNPEAAPGNPDRWNDRYGR